MTEMNAKGVPPAVLKMARIAEAQRAAYASVPEAQKIDPIPKRGDILASPYHWIDPADLPRRQWMYGRSFIRKFVTVTVAPGGVGKTALSIVEALALVTGRPLIGKQVEKPSRIWVWNLEDPIDELQRRIQAACLHYDVTPADIEGRLFVDSGREHPLCVAVTTRNRTVIQRPIVDQLAAEIRRRKIDIFIVDPFVSSHMAPENDNSAMDMIAKEWSRLADITNSAIHLIHHTRKLGSDAEVTAESSRGGKALTDAAREVRAINRMSADEGAKFGVENHRNYFRMYSDKANMAPPADLSDWYEIQNVELPNGDHVGVVATWSPPDAFDAVTPAHLLSVQRRVAADQYRSDPRAKEWVGHAIAEVIGLDMDAATDRQKAKLLIKTWIKNGALKEAIAVDLYRNKVKIIEVGKWADA